MVSSCVWYIWADKDKLFKASFHPHFHKHLCLPCFFKECRRQLTHHLAPQLLNLNWKVWIYSATKTLTVVFLLLLLFFSGLLQLLQKSGHMQVFPVSKQNTYGTDIQFCIKAIVLLLLPSEQNVFDCWMNPPWTLHSVRYLCRYDGFHPGCTGGWIFGRVQDAHHGVCLLVSDESLNHW